MSAALIVAASMVFTPMEPPPLILPASFACEPCPAWCRPPPPPEVIPWWWLLDSDHEWPPFPRVIFLPPPPRKP